MALLMRVIPETWGVTVLVSRWSACTQFMSQPSSATLTSCESSWRPVWILKLVHTEDTHPWTWPRRQMTMVRTCACCSS
ncbi:unnamed protein product [Durusdinium trenchii]|uniref:Secreted protein n=2 Tax=Durusdinium trenchii TaxID=1381693 RepID=A0ABP0KE45_9DINO